MPEDATAEFREKFRLDTLTIGLDEDWVLSVRPAQPTLGSLVLSTRHGETSLAQLAARSGDGLVRWIAHAERVAKKVLGAQRINVLCLMMQDPLVHFHLVPRYGAAVRFADRSWRDAGWPGPPDLSTLNPVDDKVLRSIAEPFATPARS